MNNLNLNDIEILQIDDDFNSKNNKSKKIKLVLILLIIFLTLAIGVGLFLFLKFAKDNVNIADKVKNISIELGTNEEDIKIEGCKLNLNKVNLEKVGKYNYTADCKGKKYSAKLKIVDTISPEVEVKFLNLTKDEILKPEDLVLSYKDLSEVKFEINGNNKIDPGLNLINILAKDEAGNVTNKDTIVYVTNVKATKFVNFSKVISTDYNATLNIVDRIGFNSSNYYINAIRIYDYSFNSKKEYEKTKNESIDTNKIDGIAGKIIYDDENFNIKLFIELTKQDLDMLNGDFPAVIDDITKLYINLNYIMKVEINK